MKNANHARARAAKEHTKTGHCRRLGPSNKTVYQDEIEDLLFEAVQSKVREETLSLSLGRSRTYAESRA